MAHCAVPFCAKLDADLREPCDRCSDKFGLGPEEGETDG